MSAGQAGKRILIVDDHPLFRQGLIATLGSVAWLEEIREADNGEDGLHSILEHDPDLVTLDLAMPGMDGLQLLERIRDIEAPPQIIVLTSFDDAAYLDRAFDLGARAYVLKDSAGEDIVECLEHVIEGKLYVSPSLGHSQTLLPSRTEEPPWRELLTEAEVKVMHKVALFMTSKEIARDLGISHRTVQNHRANVARKLDLQGNHQLMAFAQTHMAGDPSGS